LLQKFQNDANLHVPPHLRLCHTLLPPILACHVAMILSCISGLFA
jgi:hypothetical protein